MTLMKTLLFLSLLGEFPSLSPFLSLFLSLFLSPFLFHLLSLLEHLPSLLEEFPSPRSPALLLSPLLSQEHLLSPLSPPLQQPPFRWASLVAAEELPQFSLPSPLFSLQPPYLYPSPFLFLF